MGGDDVVVDQVNMPKRETWVEYEREKRKLQARNLDPREYERLIRELAKRLGV
jgi:hypothetical protein